jgi:BirA family transcriptional regulator, biotin operon repressor / biotin---[acetyl-CoA-carboxylase] ligase
LKLPQVLSEAGDELVHLGSVVSTMDEARGRAPAKSGNRLWIVADQQTGGRGRQGRQWQSPHGNLYLTVLLPAPCPLRDQPKLGFVAGVALCCAVRSLIHEPDSARLKWPNDLLIGGAKISGLLLEGLTQGEAVAIGIGVNIAAFPDQVSYTTTALNAEGQSITPAQLFETLASHLVKELAVFGDGAGFPLVRQRWLAFAAHLNKRITVHVTGKSIDGIFRDIDESGRLVLETPGGMALIDAGDVFPLDK